MMVENEEIKVCEYDVIKVCDGLFCRPHPCNYFLEMDEAKYELLKAYSIRADVNIHHQKLHANTKAEVTPQL